MDEFLEIRKRAIESYVPKQNDISDRMQEIKDIAKEIFESIKSSFINQALDPTIPVLYYEYRNPKRFSGYDSEYIKGYPSRKVLVLVVLEEMCRNQGIIFIKDTPRMEGELNWQFLKILPAYSYNNSKQENIVGREKKTS